MNINEAKIKKYIHRIVKESVEDFLNKWEYPNTDRSQQKLMDNFSNSLLEEMNSRIEKYGWEIVPMFKEVTKGGNKYTAYICIPNANALRVADWAYVAGDLNLIASKENMVVEHGKYKGIITNKPEQEEKPKKIKRGSEPAAEVDKTGAHFFIIRPRSENKF